MYPRTIFRRRGFWSIFKLPHLRRFQSKLKLIRQATPYAAAGSQGGGDKPRGPLRGEFKRQMKEGVASWSGLYFALFWTKQTQNA